MEPEKVRREVVLPAPPEEVWAALVLPERLSAWFGARVDMPVASPGARATFAFPDGSSRSAVIEVAEAERCLVLRWLPFERTAEGRLRQRRPTTVEFVLRLCPEGTRLEVTESGGTAPLVGNLAVAGASR